MELKDFVKETLSQIIDGVMSAQEYVADKGAKINPTFPPFGRDKVGEALYDEKTRTFSQNIKFDVAVTVSEGAKTKGGIGIFVGEIGIGAQGQSTASNQSMSRISFSVPVVFPKQN